ncbi:penicillin-binding protein [Ornithinimicrobium avium]|uniref:Penicillin-binding protein n=2 Tax=Ornithinimicrobium avium TaxID=2283195 RepID=A0A345NSH1_9MICO|nr:penicillin-binding protein [Ornithinimicrobium avium]
MLMGTLVGRLGQVQLAPGEQASALAAEETREVTTPALRGRLLAADGTPLATNAPSTVVTVEPEVLLESADGGRGLVEKVARGLGLSGEQLWGRTLVCGGPEAPPVPLCFSGSPYEPVPLAYGVDPERALALLERPEELPGIGVGTVPVRDYPAPDGVVAAHVLGYLGAPTQEEVDGSEGLVTAQTRVGRAGLEEVYDEVLRGSPGRRVVNVDPRGVVTGQVSQADPVPGADVRTHLDVQVQAAAEKAVAGAVQDARRRGSPARSAAAVVLRPDSGAVVAAASWPTFDPAMWTSGISQEEYAALLDPEGGRPLVDRVVAQTFPPASTYKVVSLPAAVQTGVDPGGRYACPASVSIGGQTFRNYESQAHGLLTLPEIVEVSCDTSFYRWAYDQWRSLGGLAQESDAGDRFVAVARGFGLGRATGVDLPGEAPGRVPSREWKRDYWEATREESCRRAEDGYPEVKDREHREFLEQLARESCEDGWQWRPGDAVNASIGQGDVAVTPLQLAVVYAAVAQDGRLWQPHVAADVQDRDGALLERVEPVPLGRVSIAPEVLDVLREGLEGVNVRGTAASAFRGWPHTVYPLAGKTGSAEVLGQDATSWYASYGPADHPEYVVVVMVEEGGLGGDTAAPAARDIWEVLRARS